MQPRTWAFKLFLLTDMVLLTLETYLMKRLSVVQVILKLLVILNYKKRIALTESEWKNLVISIYIIDKTI